MFPRYSKIITCSFHYFSLNPKMMFRGILVAKRRNIVTCHEVRPRTCHEGPEGEQRCTSTLALTSAIDGGGQLTPRRTRFTPGIPDTDYVGGWVGARAGLDGYGMFCRHRDSIPGPSIPQRVAPTSYRRLHKLELLLIVLGDVGPFFPLAP